MKERKMKKKRKMKRGRRIRRVLLHILMGIAALIALFYLGLLITA